MCDNKVSEWVPKGYDYKEYVSTCSSTGSRGQLLLCDKCENQREAREENSEADNAWLRSAGWGEI